MKRERREDSPTVIGEGVGVAVVVPSSIVNHDSDGRMLDGLRALSHADDLNRRVAEDDTLSAVYVDFRPLSVRTVGTERITA